MKSDKTSEQIEREAREALVAADLSAKMKQWSTPPPGHHKGGRSNLRLLLLLLALGGAAWWLLSRREPEKTPQNQQSLPQNAPVTPPSAPSTLPDQNKQQPVAQQPVENRYLTLAQANYQAPDFAAEIRGEASASQDALNAARQALANHRPADALTALQNVPAEYQTDADYLKGHALFALKKYGASAAVFGQLTESVRYGEAAEWYAIVATLPAVTESNKSLIMKRLKVISEDQGHTFQREAADLYRLL